MEADKRFPDNAFDSLDDSLVGYPVARTQSISVNYQISRL